MFPPRFSTFLAWSLVVLTIGFSACARIPSQSVALSDQLRAEVARMHQLNVALTNNLFQRKRADIDAFIEKEYIPSFAATLMKSLPADFNVKDNFPALLSKSMVRISARRDSMQTALDAQRISLIERLNEDYRIYERGAVGLQALLESAVKVSDSRQQAFSQLKSLSGNRIDLNAIEGTIDTFIRKGGKLSDNIQQLNDDLTKLFNPKLPN
ncbi:hypothetical protein EXU85_20145 [Spirosoma sp. KCTC 42546]|uniref:hypothetical protein n=1 Tax=Spirosoma sp. KCTC 42546 TaxID=2520506 RepID=UPI0011590997|nr:hypothetical protein [Spirosoma sp. KCTC 42546]QDK80792.1 hypothetical protein EXU85_20145 [Spirosoma sp. KCTC 42546]